MDIMLKSRTQKALFAKLLELGLCDNDDDDFRNAVSNVSFAYPHVWSTPPVFDEEGELVTEGIESSYYHINIRDNRKNGIKNQEPYDEETNPTGIDWGDVRWVDPADIATPAMVWA